MIRQSEIWLIINSNLQREKWIPLDAIYCLIERYGKLDDDDFEPQAPESGIPKWKRNVRNVLQYRKRIGHIQWDGRGNYFLH